MEAMVHVGKPLDARDKSRFCTLGRADMEMLDISYIVALGTTTHIRLTSSYAYL